MPPVTRSVGGSEDMFITVDGALFKAQRSSGDLARIDGFPPLLDAAASGSTLYGLDGAGTVWMLREGASKPERIADDLRGLGANDDAVYTLDADGRLLSLDPKTLALEPVADAPACVRRVRGEDGGVAIDIEGEWTWLHPARTDETAALQARLDAAYDPLRRRASLVQLGDGRVGAHERQALVDVSNSRTLLEAGPDCKLVITGAYAFRDCSVDEETGLRRITALYEGGHAVDFHFGLHGTREPLYGAGPWVLGPGPDSTLVLGPDGVNPLQLPDRRIVNLSGEWLIADASSHWWAQSLVDGQTNEFDTTIRARRLRAVEGGLYRSESTRRARTRELRARRERRRKASRGEPVEEPAEEAPQIYTFVIGSPVTGMRERPLPEGATGVAMASVTRGIAAGEHAGLLWTTADGGETWQPAELPIDGDPSAITLDEPKCENRSCSVGRLVWFDVEIVPPSNAPELRLLGRPRSRPTRQWSEPCAPLRPSKDPPTGVPQIVCKSETECTVSHRWLRATSNEAFLRTARVVPSQRDGKVQGFKIYGIRPGSPAKALNLRNGDMLVSVNDVALTSVDAATKAWNDVVAHGGPVRVVILRKGKTMSLSLTVE